MHSRMSVFHVARGGRGPGARGRVRSRGGARAEFELVGDEKGSRGTVVVVRTLAVDPTGHHTIVASELGAAWYLAADGKVRELKELSKMKARARRAGVGGARV